MLHTVNKKVVSIMVESDASLGLSVEVEIISGENMFVHKIDYHNIPFHYHFSQDTRHLRDKFPWILYGSQDES